VRLQFYPVVVARRPTHFLQHLPRDTVELVDVFDMCHLSGISGNWLLRRELNTWRCRIGSIRLRNQHPQRAVRRECLTRQRQVYSRYSFLRTAFIMLPKMSCLPESGRHRTASHRLVVLCIRQSRSPEPQVGFLTISCLRTTGTGSPHTTCDHAFDVLLTSWKNGHKPSGLTWDQPSKLSLFSDARMNPVRLGVLSGLQRSAALVGQQA